MRKAVLFLLLALPVFFSCRMEKRHYTKGYYIHGRSLKLHHPEEKNQPAAYTLNPDTQASENQNPKIPASDSISSSDTTLQPEITTVGKPALKESDLPVTQKTEISPAENLPVVASDTTHKSRVEQNKKNLEDGDEVEEYLLGSNIMLSLCLLFILKFIVNPTLAMIWLTVCLFGPMAVVSLAMVLFFLVKGTYGIIKKWYSSLQRKRISWLLIWGLFAVITAVLVTLMLIAMFA